MMDATDYTMTAGHAEELLGAAVIDLDTRRAILRLIASNFGRDGLIEMFAQFIGMANSVVENNREMVELILVCEGMDPRSAEKVNLPTMFGALQGVKLAEGIDQALLCAGCAFRPGTPANQSPSTTTDADWCGHPGDVPFMCHDDLDDRGEPTHACPGFAQLRGRRKREDAA